MAKDHAQLTVREIHGPYMQLLTNLQGADGAMWLENLNRFNAKQPTWAERFSIWKTVAAGIGQTSDDLVYRIRNAHHLVEGKPARFVDYAITEAIEVWIDMSPIEGGWYEFDVVIAKVSQLGFRGPTTYQAFYERGCDYGLKGLSAEEAVMLRLAFPEQPEVTGTVAVATRVPNSIPTQCELAPLLKYSSEDRRLVLDASPQSRHEWMLGTDQEIVFKRPRR